MANLFLRAYEFEKRYNLERLRYTLEQAEAALKEFRPETIDFAKSALETICKVVLAERDVTTVNGKDVASLDFPPLVKEALKALGCQDEKLRKHLGGLAQSMAETRNRETVAGHGQDGDKAFIGKPGITLFMLTFSTIMEAIMGLLEAETPDLMTTKMTFDAVEDRLGLGPWNRDIDSWANVEYSAEDGRIFIDGKELRPSEILYHFDRTTYQQGIESAHSRLREVMEVQIKGELSSGRFDNVLPGTGGYLPSDIWVDDIRQDNGMLIATGAVIRIGVAGDGYDFRYTAAFVLGDDPETSLDMIELDSLDLKVNDQTEHEPDEADA